MSILVKGTTCHLEESITLNIDVEKFIDCNLTYQEIVVSSFLVKGIQPKEISEIIFLSRRHVTSIVKNIRSKFREFMNNYN